MLIVALPQLTVPQELPKRYVDTSLWCFDAKVTKKLEQTRWQNKRSRLTTRQTLSDGDLNQARVIRRGRQTKKARTTGDLL